MLFRSPQTGVLLIGAASDTGPTPRKIRNCTSWTHPAPPAGPPGRGRRSGGNRASRIAQRGPAGPRAAGSGTGEQNLPASQDLASRAEAPDPAVKEEAEPGRFFRAAGKRKWVCREAGILSTQARDGLGQQS